MYSCIFWFYFLIFILGSSLASFAHVLGVRTCHLNYNEEKFTSRRSYCDNCFQIILWHDLIPLYSFLKLAGRTRCCNQALSPSYFWVECLGGFGLLNVTLLYHFNLISTESLILISVLLFFSCSFIASDLHYLRLPNPLTFSFALLAIIFLLLTEENIILSRSLFAIGLLFLFSLYSYLRPGKVGGGDLKLIAALALWFDSYSLSFILLIASMAGLITFYFSNLHQKRMTRLPFGPYLMLSALFTAHFQDLISAH